MAFLPRIIEVNPMVSIIDRIGDLQVEITAREAEVKELKEKLAVHLSAAEVAQFQGKRFYARWIRRETPRTDWRKVAEKLNPSRQLIAAHTRRSVSEYSVISKRKDV